MLYTCESLSFTIDVYDEYRRINPEKYHALGLNEIAQSQTLFMFATNGSLGFKDFFNITRDAKYASNEEAMLKGVALNINNLEQTGATILSNEKLTLSSGRHAVKVITQLPENKFACIFTAVHGVLICLGYTYNEDLITREQSFNEFVNSIKEF